jgi:hypothetical protein
MPGTKRTRATMAVVGEQESRGHHAWRGRDLYGFGRAAGGAIAASAMGVLGQHIDNLTPPPSNIFQIWHWHSQIWLPLTHRLHLHPSFLSRTA